MIGQIDIGEVTQGDLAALAELSEHPNLNVVGVYAHPETEGRLPYETAKDGQRRHGPGTPPDYTVPGGTERYLQVTDPDEWEDGGEDIWRFHEQAVDALTGGHPERQGTEIIGMERIPPHFATILGTWMLDTVIIEYHLPLDGGDSYQGESSLGLVDPTEEDGGWRLNKGDSEESYTAMQAALDPEIELPEDWTDPIPATGLSPG